MGEVLECAVRRRGGHKQRHRHIHEYEHKRLSACGCTAEWQVVQLEEMRTLAEWGNVSAVYRVNAAARVAVFVDDLSTNVSDASTVVMLVFTPCVYLRTCDGKRACASGCERE
jgi:hypothetical protein